MKINWTPQKRKISELIHWDKNPRMITDEKMNELKEKIQERGFHDIIKIDTDNTILSGNMRKEALIQIGIEEVNVLVPDRKLTTEERVLVGMESNIMAGDWDRDKLAEFDMDILLKSGMDENELSDMFNNVEILDDDFDEKKAKEIAEKNTTVKLGDIYQLGEHRLMCGDSLEHEQVGKLMGEERAAMIYADPPYNIGLDYSKGISTNGKYQGTEKKVLNDNKTIANYENFLSFTILNAIKYSKEAVHIFYWCDEKYIGLLQSIYEKLGINNKRVCIWIKNNFNMTPQIAFNKVYEPCVYGTIGQPYINPEIRNLNEILNKEVNSGNQVHDEIFDIFNLWLVRRDNAQSYEHPTQKPLTLHEKPLKRCTKPGDAVLDLFGGSGSTLMACEQLKRKAFLMEINPIFCQVIINRYESTTGNKATKIS